MANVANLCRLCGTNTIGIVRHNIFEGEGLAKKFADKIADCLPVNVSIEDRLPKILCGECSYKLDLLSDFRDVCVKTETLLLSLIDGIKHEVCDVDAEEEEVKGEVVQRRSSRRTSQKRALEEIEESEKEASEDDFCMDDGGDRDDDDEDEEFVVKTPAKKRSRKSGEPKKPEKPKEKFPCVPVKVEIVENEKLECSKCQKILKLRHLWIAHEKRPHTHFCQTCLRYFVSYRDYTSHNCIYKCTYCDRKTKSKEKLDLHIYRFHEGNERFVCDICKDEFRTKSSLATHIIAKGFVHTPTVTWCVKCCEDFKTPQWLKKHQLRVHEGKIICHQCTKTFPTKEERMRHTKEMHPRVKEKVKCPQCDLILSCKGGLVKHVDVVHKKLRPFLCPVCGKSYPLKKSLEFHMTMHTGEKNHVCKVCGHKFARIENLKQHMRIHNNEKPYSCEFCGRQFRQCGPLNIHRRTHTGETPYACHLCPQKFISNNHLKLHLNNHPAY